LPSYFWGIYEVDFPEGSNVKAPRGHDFPFGAFLPTAWKNFLPFKNLTSKTEKKGGEEDAHIGIYIEFSFTPYLGRRSFWSS
jgi:hypothetical protein